MSRLPAKSARGFSLLEMALVLLVMGAVGLLAWRLLPVLTGISEGDAAARQLLQAEEAVLGFALAHGRLPCPDGNSDGVEDCGVQAGLLPLRTLGLPVGAPIRYATDPSLTTAAVRYVPAMSGAPVRAAGLLDLCVALRSAQVSGLPVAAQAAGLDVAFALATPRRGDAARSPSRAFFAPDDPAAPELTRATGLPVLLTRLGCPAWLAQADALSQRVMAAENAQQVAAGAVEFQRLAVSVRDANLVKAIASEAIAVADLGLAVATGITGGVLTVQTGGAVAPAVASVAVAAALATANLVLATLSMVEAIELRADTLARLHHAEAYLVAATAAAQNERARAVQRYAEVY